ncbi:hypothetical protein NHP22001_07230 [Helicobacter sp. NHP22-001]|nr:hypothetical protein NHP22001_07230 [Helicobacter sp. NHP22-001]
MITRVADMRDVIKGPLPQTNSFPKKLKDKGILTRERESQEGFKNMGLNT